MPAPGVVNDGNFRVTQQNGATSFSYPFAASRSDFQTFIATRPMRVEEDYFRMPVEMAQKNFGTRGVAYLVNVTDPQAVEGTNLIDYSEIYASVPNRQTAYGTVAASIQRIENLAAPGDPPVFVPINISDTFDGVYYYDYSLNEPLAPIFRSVLKQYPGGVVNALQFGLDITQPPSDGLYLAQNSSSERWMGGIYCRESVYVKVPPIKKWNPPA